MNKNKSFTFNPNFCLIDYNYYKPKSSCVFDYWSIHHFYWQGFFYIIIHHYLKLKNPKHILLLLSILTILHAFEEYLGNIGMLSLEGIFIDNLSPLFDSKVDVSLRVKDNDYMDNSIGDVISGVLSCILIIIYWYKFKKLPYFYIFLSIFILYLLYQKRNMLYHY